MTTIELRGVGHDYDIGGSVRTVLQDIDVTLTERRIGVIGANGSGKSTFARLLNGLVIPTRGEVRVDGIDTTKHARQVRRTVGFVFTDADAQIVMPTVGEDVAFSLRRHRLDKAEVARRVDDALAEFGLLEHRDHPAHLLSGGQKQLLALASVLVTGPTLLVMDEPTTLLDLTNTRRIRGIIAGLSQQVVIVSHDLDLIEDTDRVLVLAESRLVFDGAPTAAVKHYRALVS